MISTHRATGSLLGEIRSRTPSWSTSAAVPGVEPRPASRSRSNTARGARPLTSHMCATSIGEYACRCSCGAIRLANAQPLLVVLEPPVGMDPGLDADLGRARTRPPRRRAARTPPRSARRRRASACDCPKPQNAQPTTQMFETLMLRLTTNVTVSPARPRRSSSAAHAHLLDHRGPLLGEQRRQLLGGQRQPVARPAHRARRRVVGHGDARRAGPSPGAG